MDKKASLLLDSVWLNDLYCDCSFDLLAVRQNPQGGDKFL